MSMRALQSVLNSSSLAKSTIACICSEYCIVFYVYLAGSERGAGNSATGVLNVRNLASGTLTQFIVAGLDPGA